MRVVREKPKGRQVDILVCGELMSGIVSDGTLFVEHDVHSAYAGGVLVPSNVQIWRGKRFAPCGHLVAVYDKRPLKKF